MNTDLQRICAWCGSAAMLLFFIGLVIADWLPLPAPSMTAEEVAAMFRDNTFWIRSGAVVVLVSSLFAAPFYGLITVHMREMEGHERPAMSLAQLSAGSANILFFILPALLYVVACYRPERNPDITLALNDLAWIVTILPWPMTACQALMIGLVILKHFEQRPVFPRWLGFFNVWVAVVFIPGSLIPYFKTGPFAWNGILAFWLPATAFGIWFIVMQVELLKIIKREARAGVGH